jgi:hypothetical protein
MSTVAYASFCCQKDMERVLSCYVEHVKSHAYGFAEHFLIFQRCAPLVAKESIKINLPGQNSFVHIADEDYPGILGGFQIEYPNKVLDELTHGWGAPHFWAHHMVNHLKAALLATSDYIVFSDGDCFIKNQPAEQTWISEGIDYLQTNPDFFVVSPNDGSPMRLETTMSQQMFLVKRSEFLNMEFIPWDGKFIEGGPMQEYYGMLEGWIGRYLLKSGRRRFVLPPEFRYWHLGFH